MSITTEERPVKSLAGQQIRADMAARRAGGEVAVPEPADVTSRQGDVAVREPLSGARVLGHTAAWMTEHAHYPSPHALVTAALWAAHAWARDDNGVLIWPATPRLMYYSTEGDSGKSTGLEQLAMITPEAYGLTLRVTESGLVQAIGRHETLFLDETDGLFGSTARSVAARTILNGGYTRNGSVLNGTGQKATRVKVFGAVAFAGLASVLKSPREDIRTLGTRCIGVHWAPVDDELPEWPPRDTSRPELLKAALQQWTLQERDVLAAANPVLPPGIVRRNAQMWRPLIACADAAGEDWPEAARRAAVELCAGSRSENVLDELDALGSTPLSPLGGLS